MFWWSFIKLGYINILDTGIQMEEKETTFRTFKLLCKIFQFITVIHGRYQLRVEEELEPLIMWMLRTLWIDRACEDGDRMGQTLY